MTTHLYLDAGVVRVHEYIDRTSGSDEGPLRLRRGASRMVTSATAAARFADLGWTENPQTYTVEGVAHLRRPVDGESADAQTLAVAVLRHLREALPYAYLEASWAYAEKYADARDLMDTARTMSIKLEDSAGTAGSGALAWLPATREDPRAARCKACGLAVAETREATCCDCRKRETAGQNARSTTSRSGANHRRRSPEQETLAALKAVLGVDKLDPVRDLNDLSGRPSTLGAKVNHLATIYADGNNVGNLLHQLTPERATTVSTALDSAIRDAGRDALAAIYVDCRPGRMPGVVTTLAADDALVTVPASLGWPFVLTLVEGFNKKIKAALRDLDPVPTLTAGIVFSQTKHPIEETITTAEELMKASKKAVNGAASCIGWVDLTLAWHVNEAPTREIDWFTRHREAVNGFARMPANQRQKWLRDISTCRGQVPPGELRAYLESEANRLGLGIPLDALDLDDIQDAIRVARWWPKPGTPSSPNGD